MKSILHINLSVAEHFITNQLTGINDFNQILVTNKNLSYEPEETSNSIFNKKYYLDDFSMTRLRCRALIFHLMKRYFYLEGILRKENPNIIHVHYGTAAANTIYLKKIFDLPFITSFYGGDLSTPLRMPRMKSKYQMLFQLGDLFLVEGTFAKKTLINLGCPEHKIYIHHLGVDPRNITFIPRELKSQESIKIFMCSRFEEKKGYTIALRSFKKLIDEGYNTELIIIGDGELKREIINLIQNLEIGSYVKLLGKLNYEEYLKISQSAHFFLMPSITSKDSRTEGGAPTVLIEMQAAGMPIVATKHADIPEVVLDGKSGFLAEEGNINDLTNKLKLMIDDRDKWVQMGLLGRKHIEENYNSRVQSKKLESIYNNILSNRL